MVGRRGGGGEEGGSMILLTRLTRWGKKSYIFHSVHDHPTSAFPLPEAINSSFPSFKT